MEPKHGSLLPLLFSSGRFPSFRSSGFAFSRQNEQVHVCSAHRCEPDILVFFNLEDIGSPVLCWFMRYSGVNQL